MIFFLLILGMIEISYATGWNLGNSYRGFTFGEIFLNHASINHDLSKWDHISTDRKSNSGLQTWLTDVVVGKHDDNYIKPVIKNIGYPVYKDVEFKVPNVDVQHVSQPYPVLVPVIHPIPYEVTKTIVKTIEKKVPTPVEKIVPVPVEKPVPFEIVKHVPVLVENKIPIKIPVYKTLYHKIH